MINERLAHDLALIEPALSTYLSGECGQGYDRIFEAAKYSALAGGKRLRPVLVLEFCRLCGGTEQAALPFACALELIHTYSLVHDDLPCMDDDAMRRGRPTSHVRYGEALAILAGDGLLTRAFGVAAGADLPPAVTLRGIQLLSDAAGMDGMIAGQVLDLDGEGKSLTLEQLERLQNKKTGCLFRVACELGCTAAQSTDADTLQAARRYGDALGLAFQIRDDLLDLEGDATALGKSVGKDVRDQKSTFPALLGVEACRDRITMLTEHAVKAVETIGDSAFLISLARALATRNQ